jgi:hypothetical protein
MSAAAALLVAVALAGCGTTTYFAGRTLPPSGLANRVLIAIQNPSSANPGTLQFVDAYYDIRYKYNSTNTSPAFSVSGYSGSLPISIQNMPEEQLGAVYGSGDGSLMLINYAKETSVGSAGSLPVPSSSVFVTRDQLYVFATSTKGVLTIVDKSTTNAGTYTLSASEQLYRVSVNPGGSAALIFAQNSNHLYYPRKLSSGESIAYSGGAANWPKAAVDCEPLSQPGWCLFQAQSPDTLDPKTNTYYGTPLAFDRPVKAVFSSDGGTAYVLSCGPECGGSEASVSSLPVAPLLYLIGQASGALPSTTTTLSTQCGTVNLTIGCTPTPGGASNALVDSSTLYVVGQSDTVPTDGYWGGYLSVITLPTGSATAMTLSSQVSISDGVPGGPSRMILADDNTLWIAMTKCANGERYHNSPNYVGCLTMVNTTTNTVTLLEPTVGDATGIAAVTGLHKIYAAVGGQVYIYSTADGSPINNTNVTVTGTAYDVAYMDGLTDANNTVY